MKAQKLLDIAVKPIILGLAIAAVLLLAFPELRIKQEKILLAPTEAPAQPAKSDWMGPVSYAEAVAKASPAVVSIYTKQKFKRNHPRYANNPIYRSMFNRAKIPQQERMRSTLGSGVIVNQEGYLLTNEHVIVGAQQIIVQLQDGREAQAELIGVDKQKDLAVLHIDLPNLQPISIDKPENARVGDTVLAIGNPFGIGQSVSQGIISAIRFEGLSNSELGNFIQTDAAIYSGQSGGALIDAYGNLVGINSSKVFDPGESIGAMGFAVPAKEALAALEDIIQYGSVVRGWLGVTASQISPQLARQYRLPINYGVIITKLVPDGPAETAGLRVGDIVVKVNNQNVVNGLQTIYKIRETRPGESIEMSIFRDGQYINVSAILGTEPTPS